MDTHGQPRHHLATTRVLHSPSGGSGHKASYPVWNLSRFTTRLLLPLAIAAVLSSGAARGGEQFATANIVLNVSSHVTCQLTNASLTYDFTSLQINVARSLALPFTVSCDGDAKVQINTSWDGAPLKGKTHTFSNGDTVDVQVCYKGSATSCWDQTNNVWTANPKRDLDLRLTYTAKVAESNVTRQGVLQLSYD